MLFRNNYGVDLGSSSVKVYSFFRNKSYIEKNMVAYRGRRILAIGNEAYEMFEKSPADISVNSPMAFGMLANLELQEIVLYRYDCYRKEGILSSGQWSLAAEKPCFYGGVPYCRCHCHGNRP